jgi:hypothetical protein
MTDLYKKYVFIMEIDMNMIPENDVTGELRKELILENMNSLLLKMSMKSFKKYQETNNKPTSVLL